MWNFLLKWYLWCFYSKWVNSIHRIKFKIVKSLFLVHWCDAPEVESSSLQTFINSFFWLVFRKSFALDVVFVDCTIINIIVVPDLELKILCRQKVIIKIMLYFWYLRNIYKIFSRETPALKNSSLLKCDNMYACYFYNGTRLLICQ